MTTPSTVAGDTLAIKLSIISNGSTFDFTGSDVELKLSNITEPCTIENGVIVAQLSSAQTATLPSRVLPLEFQFIDAQGVVFTIKDGLRLNVERESIEQSSTTKSSSGRVAIYEVTMNGNATTSVASDMLLVVGGQGGAVVAGINGKSAYEIAQDKGFTGTEAEWLASLVGANGAQGIQGAKGDKGDTGNAGADGASVTSSILTQAQYDALTQVEKDDVTKIYMVVG